MGIVEWATSPWGQQVPIHIAWFLIWVAAIAGLLFFDRARHLRGVFRTRQRSSRAGLRLNSAARVPERVPRHSLAARLFHWVMAASMFTLLFTAFLPKVGVRFDWVTYHWIAGIGANRLDRLSHHPRLFLAGLLVDLAGQGRY